MTPHLKLEKGQISPYVLVCGDPARALETAKLCNTYEELAYNREYRSFNGLFNEEKITIVSHGVGSAGASICFNELVAAGAKVIVRAGTCGALQDSLEQGDLIVASGAVREDGVSALMVPLAYPAIADAEVLRALEKACRNLNAVYQRGIILTSDLFYPSVLPTSLETYKNAKVAGVEMECASLFVIAALGGVRAGAVVAVDGNPLKWNEGDYDPYGEKVAAGKEKMLLAALAALSEMSKTGLI